MKTLPIDVDDIGAIDDGADNLPASVRQLISLIGLVPTLALINTFAGQILSIPVRDDPAGERRRRLVEVIGATATSALIANYPGQRLPIPRCVAAMRDARDRRIIAAYDRGASVAALTGEFWLTDRQIRTILKRCPGPVTPGLAPGSARQLGLF